MRPVIFIQPARTELVEAQDWYERESPGLGRRFRAAVDDTVERIRDNPLQFPIVHRNLRRALLHRFPYALMFVLQADETVTVIACFHGSRAPMVWHKRT